MQTKILGEKLETIDCPFCCDKGTCEIHQEGYYCSSCKETGSLAKINKYLQISGKTIYVTINRKGHVNNKQ